MWDVRALIELEESLHKSGISDGPLVALEVGGRKPKVAEKGNEPFYALSHKRVYLFEADEEEAGRLNELYPAESGITVLPYALGRTDEERAFNITKQRGSSSLYQPNKEFLSQFHGFDGVSIERTVQVQTKSLESVCEKEEIERIDLLKMDVQGAEGEILEGGGQRLASLLGVVTEVSFAELYIGQPTFDHIHRLLTDLGLTLHHRVSCGTRAMQRDAPGKEQELWGDYLYLRPMAGLPEEQLARLALIAGLYDCHHVVVSALRQIGSSEADAFADRYTRSVMQSEDRRNNRLRRAARILLYGHDY